MFIVTIDLCDHFCCEKNCIRMLIASASYNGQDGWLADEICIAFDYCINSV